MAELAAPAERQPTVTILRNGLVYSPPAVAATALVMIDDRVSYVGSDAGARTVASGAPEVDLNGRLVTPAFVDAHLHVIQTGQLIAGMDLHSCRSRDEVLTMVSSYASTHRGRRILVGQGWDERNWPDPSPPTRAELDRAARGVAVYLARVDVHSAVVSTALQDEVPAMTTAEGYRSDGLLTRHAHHLARQRMDRLFSDAERRSDARTALLQAASLGVGAVHELGGPHLGPIEDLIRVREVADELGIGLVSYWGELASSGGLEKARAVGAAGLAGDLCIDGSIGSHTAALFEPYRDQVATGSGRGVRYLTDDEIIGHIIDCTRAGVQAGFHCIGDEAIAAAVEGFRRAVPVVGVEALRRCRHRLEHIEMAAETDFATLAECGVTASLQPAFDALWGGPGELYEQRLGSARAAQMNRCGSLHRAGVPLALGTDSPVTPVAGWETVRAAVRHWQPSERMTVEDAFLAATVGGHWATGVDNGGLLRPGWRADLAVWDVVGSVTPSGLPQLEAGTPLPACAATVVAGRQIYGTAEWRLPGQQRLTPGRAG